MRLSFRTQLNFQRFGNFPRGAENVLQIVDGNLLMPDFPLHNTTEAVALSLILYAMQYLGEKVQAACRTLHPDLKETEVWVMGQRLKYFWKLAAENPLANCTPLCPYVHYFMGGTHSVQEFEAYKKSYLQSQQVDKTPEKEVELIAEFPPEDDGLVTIRCQWEDLLEHFKLQMWLGCRVTTKQCMQHTKEYFSKFTLGKASITSSQMGTNVSTFKSPKTRNEEEALQSKRLVRLHF